MKDLIPGGLADNKSDKDFDKKDVSKGSKVEREHTSNPAIAKEIAKDHLTEDKEYYNKLEKMEKKAFFESFTKRAGIKEKLLSAANHPIGKSALFGAAAGAGGNMAVGDEKESIGKRALKGAAMGGALGAAGGALHHKLNSKTPSFSTSTKKGKVEVMPAASKSVHKAAPKPDVDMKKSFNGTYKVAFILGFEKQANRYQSIVSLKSDKAKEEYRKEHLSHRGGQGAVLGTLGGGGLGASISHHIDMNSLNRSGKNIHAGKALALVGGGLLGGGLLGRYLGRRSANKHSDKASKAGIGMTTPTGDIADTFSKSKRYSELNKQAFITGFTKQAISAKQVSSAIMKRYKSSPSTSMVEKALAAMPGHDESHRKLMEVTRNSLGRDALKANVSAAQKVLQKKAGVMNKVNAGIGGAIQKGKNIVDEAGHFVKQKMMNAKRSMDVGQAKAYKAPKEVKSALHSRAPTGAPVGPSAQQTSSPFMDKFKSHAAVGAAGLAAGAYGLHRLNKRNEEPKYV